MNPPLGGQEVIERLRGLDAEVQADRRAFDRARRIPDRLFDRLCAEAQAFRLLTPKVFGGLELELPDAVRVIEEASFLNGAVGWLVMIGNGGGFSGALSHEAGRKIFSDPRAFVGGVLAPLGRAQAAPGGFRVSGRWPFSSGCHHATWQSNACVVYDGETPRRRADDSAETRLVFLERAQFRIEDTWRVRGLRGTGSDDVVAEDVFVPEALSCAYPNAAPPTHPGPLYRFPVRTLIAAIVAAVPLGIARRALREFVDLAARKKPFASSLTLQDSPVVQRVVAEADALLASARSHLMSEVEGAWDGLVAGRAPDLAQRARILGAASHAAQTSARVVDLAAGAAGTSAIYEDSPLEQAVRDVHVTTQHAMLAPARMESVGQVLLGLTPPATALL